MRIIFVKDHQFPSARFHVCESLIAPPNPLTSANEESTAFELNGANVYISLSVAMYIATRTGLRPPRQTGICGYGFHCLGKIERKLHIPLFDGITVSFYGIMCHNGGEVIASPRQLNERLVVPFGKLRRCVHDQLKLLSEFQQCGVIVIAALNSSCKSIKIRSHNPPKIDGGFFGSLNSRIRTKLNHITRSNPRHGFGLL